jgi:hypothetical protein
MYIEKIIDELKELENKIIKDDSYYKNLVNSQRIEIDDLKRLITKQDEIILKFNNKIINLEKSLESRK